MTQAFLSVHQIQGFDGSSGTIWFLFCPVDSQFRVPAFITARHVLDSIKSDSARLFLRKKTDSANYEVVPWTIQLRRNGRPFYKVHPDSSIDLAGMRTDLPSGIQFELKNVGKSFLATDRDFKNYEVHPGTHVIFVGYPLRLVSPRGNFPLARSGIIASYPLTPLRENPRFYVDGPVFEGNSGSPVLLDEPLKVSSDGLEYGVVPLVLGIMTRSTRITEEIHSFREFAVKEHDIYLAEVVNSDYILDFVDLLECSFYEAPSTDSLK